MDDDDFEDREQDQEGPELASGQISHDQLIELGSLISQERLTEQVLSMSIKVFADWDQSRTSTPLAPIDLDMTFLKDDINKAIREVARVHQDRIRGEIRATVPDYRSSTASFGQLFSPNQARYGIMHPTVRKVDD